MNEWTCDSRTAAIDRLLAKAPVIPVLTIADLDTAVPLARTLAGAGLPVVEITLRTPVALAAIAQVAAEVPGCIPAAGTVLTPADLAAAAAAGAAFAISPGASEALYRAAAESAIPYLPAVATGSEIVHGMEHGYRRFKYFPAVTGGCAALKAFLGPFPQVRFCPTGGIDEQDAAAYLALSNVITIGGSWIAPPTAIAARDWPTIAERAQRAASARAARFDA